MTDPTPLPADLHDLAFDPEHRAEVRRRLANPGRQLTVEEFIAEAERIAAQPATGEYYTPERTVDFARELEKGEPIPPVDYPWYASDAILWALCIAGCAVVFGLVALLIRV